VSQLDRFYAPELARFLDGMQRLNLPPPAAFTEPFFSQDMANRIVASAGKVGGSGP
jgi:hypothetical protein